MRYDNPVADFICELCQLEIPIEQEDHLWSHCTGLLGTPPSKDPLEAVYRVKRRCLEIAVAEYGSTTVSSNSSNAISAHRDEPPCSFPPLTIPTSTESGKHISQFTGRDLFSTVLKTPPKKKAQDAVRFKFEDKP